MFVANLASTVHHVPALAAWVVQEGAVGWDLVSLLKSMGILAKIVVIILFIMSGWSIGVMIDRWMAFSAARKQSRAFAPAVAGALRDGKIDEAIKVAERNKKSHLAKVVTAGLMEFKAHQDSPGEIPGETIEASKRALERTEAIVHAELKRGLGGLATIGSTAPFVGLFGTVVGILNAFKGISQEKATGLAAVAGHGDRLGEMFQCPGHRAGHTVVGRRLAHNGLHELSLAAVSVRRYDQASGH